MLIDHRIRGGESDSEEKELIVRPTNAPLGARVVTTATPVGNIPRALRNSRGSNVAAVGQPVSVSVPGDYPLLCSGRSVTARRLAAPSGLGGFA